MAVPKSMDSWLRLKGRPLSQTDDEEVDAEEAEEEKGDDVDVDVGPGKEVEGGEDKEPRL